MRPTRDQPTHAAPREGHERAAKPSNALSASARVLKVTMAQQHCSSASDLAHDLALALARQELALRDLALALWDLALRASWLSHGRPW